MFIPKSKEKHHFCFICGNEIDFDRIKMQRTDTCPHCGADLHACKNCEHWDPGLPNQCRARVTDYIADRDKNNHCTQFTFKDGAGEKYESVSVKEKLDKLFK
jgi:DNA-directed RNA polymerase subunit RPC12/RpoP